MARGARDYQHSELCLMTHEQLVETCVRLESRRQMMDILLAELHNEKTKLQRHQTMLSERISRVQGESGSCRSTAHLLRQLRTEPADDEGHSCFAPDGPSVQQSGEDAQQLQGAQLLQQWKLDRQAQAGQSATINGAAAGGDVAAGAVTMSATIAGILAGHTGGPLGSVTAPPLPSPCPLAEVSIPSSASAVSAFGAAHMPPPADKHTRLEPHAAAEVAMDLGSLSLASPTVPLVEAHAACGTFTGTSDSTASTSATGGMPTTLQEEFALGCMISAPEELLVRQNPNGNVSLTWFYNEQLLEQLMDPHHALRSLSFEIRQQSEGANGRLRSRFHVCDCHVLGNSEEVGEQSFEVEGCTIGRPYAFSVRACAQFDGQDSPMHSAYSETVTIGSSALPGSDCAAPTFDGQSTTVSTPRGMSKGEFQDAQVPELLSAANSPTRVCFGEATRLKEEEVRRQAEKARQSLDGEQLRRQVEAETRGRAGETLRAEEQAKRREAEAVKRLEETRRRLEAGAPQWGCDDESWQRADEGRAAHEEARRRTEEDALRKRAEEDAATRKLEDEASQRKLEEEVRRRVEEERLKLEADAQQRAAEMQHRAEEEARRRAAEEYRAREEAKARHDQELAERRLAEEELRRSLEQEAAQKRMEEEVLRLVAGERRRLAEEAQRAQEEARQRLEEEAAQRRFAEAQRLQAQEEEWRRAEEERQKLVDEVRRLEAETQRRLEVERREEERRREQEEARRRQEDQRRQEEAEELRKLAEEARRAEVEAKRRLEEELAQRRLEEERREQAEELARLQAYEEAQQREVEARRRQELERQRLEEEARWAEEQRRAEAQALQWRVEEERRRRAEQEEQFRLAEEARRAEEAAQRQQEEEALQRRVEEQIRMRVEAEARKRAEEDERRRKAEERRAFEQEREQQQKLVEEAVHHQRVEEEVRRRAEEEVRRRMEEEVRRSAEEAVRQWQQLPSAEDAVPLAISEVSEEVPGMEQVRGREQSAHAPRGVGDSVASSFAQGFAQYCHSKASNAPVVSGKASLTAVPSGASSQKTEEANGIFAGVSHVEPANAAARADALYSSQSPMTVPNSAVRSPLGVQTPVDMVSDALGSPRNATLTGYGAAGATTADPMDKWMTKILAERGPPPVALSPNPIEAQPPTAAAAAQLPGSRGMQRCPSTSMELQAPAPAPAQQLDQSRPTRGQLRASLPGSLNAPGQQQAGPRRKSQSPLPCVNKFPPAGGGGAGPATQGTLASGGLDGMATVMQLPKRTAPATAERGAPVAAAARAPQLPHRGPSLGPISENTRHVSDLAAARISDATLHVSVEQGIPLGESMRRQGGPGSSGATSPLGGSVIFNASPSVVPIPRANTFSAAKAFPHSSGVSPPGSGALGLGLGTGGISGGASAQRSSSFSAYPGSDARYPTMGHPGKAPCKAVQQPPAGTRRGLSPVRPQAPVPQPQPQPSSQLQQAVAPKPQGSEHRPPLEVTQRMVRANELQQRLAGGKPQTPGAPAQLPPGVTLNTPNLLNWAKEHVSRGYGGCPLLARHELPEECLQQHPCGDPDPLGLGLQTLHNLPPPPRSAPAAAEAATSSGGQGLGSSGGSSGGGGGRFSLTVLTSDSRWETLSFSARDDLEQRGSSFLQAKGLKAAFRSGLVAKMQAMISMGQANSSVDIVDLI